MAKMAKTEILVGLFLLLGLILVGGGIVLLGDFSSKEKTTYPIRVLYRDSAGLIKGSQVRLGGAKVGEVSSQPQLTETGDSVILQLRINNDINIQRGSEFRIDMQNLLGDKYIDIVPPVRPTNDFIYPNELIHGHSESDLTKIRENAVKVSNELVSLLSKLDQNSDAIIQAVNDISTAARELSDATQRLNQGVLSDANIAHVSAILGNLEKGSGQIPSVIDEARDSLAEFRSTMSDSKRLMGDASRRLDMLDEGLNEFGPTMKSLKTSADSISLFTKDLNSNKGTMGLLLKDPKFRRDFETFVRNLRDYGILRYRNPNEPEPLADPRAGYSGSRR